MRRVGAGSLPNIQHQRLDIGLDAGLVGLSGGKGCLRARLSE
jgi:hypothetical protein